MLSKTEFEIIALCVSSRAIESKRNNSNVDVAINNQPKEYAVSDERCLVEIEEIKLLIIEPVNVSTGTVSGGGIVKPHIGP